MRESDRARSLPQVRVSSRERGDIIMLGIGGFTPLDGFMTRADWTGVCEHMKTASGLFWPIPITLSTDQASASSLRIGDEIALTDPDDGTALATMVVTEKYAIDKARECAAVFRTTDPKHPGYWGDMGDRVADRLPWCMGAVLALSSLLLVVVFRSIVVPLKAALLNLLSIGAAYGVLVMVFQWGWGKELIGLEATVPIVSFIPMFMFAVLFGLSMDYEVFLLSRVREEYLATGDNDASVIRGLAGTARVITSAALIMISVFGGFVTGDDPAIKMLGLGLAVAIFVDATIVRMVLVPATMKLMGDANWWLPAGLDRRMPTVDIDGGLPERPLMIP